MLALCVPGLASCNKEIPSEKPRDPVEDNGYIIEIEGLEDGTRGSASTVELNLANLSYSSSRTVTAQLKKKSGSNWVNVTEGVVYSWTSTSADSQKFSGSGTVSQSCKIGAKAEGSGTLTVSASIGGTQVASIGVPVTVSDSRSLAWSGTATQIQPDEVRSATLNSNFSGTVTVKSNSGSFLVGTSSGSLSSTASVSFSSSKTQTIYYKYTGSQQTTVTMTASSGSISASASMSVKPLSDPVIYISWDDMDTRQIDQSGGDLCILYSVRVELDGEELDPHCEEYEVEVVDWGYDYDASGNRVEFDFDENDCEFDSDVDYLQGEADIYGYLTVTGRDYQKLGNTFNMLVKVILEDGREYSAEYLQKSQEPDPEEDDDPVVVKSIGLYYSLDGYSWQLMEECGTYSSGTGVNTSSYKGECHYRDLDVGEEYLDNGAVNAVIYTDRKARFRYYDSSGEEKTVSVSESSPTIIYDNMNARNRTNSAYPYTDGTYYVGSHKSYVVLTVRYPDSSTENYWGYITESDDFGGLCTYYN